MLEDKTTVETDVGKLNVMNAKVQDATRVADFSKPSINEGRSCVDTLASSTNDEVSSSNSDANKVSCSAAKTLVDAQDVAKVAEFTKPTLKEGRSNVKFRLKGAPRPISKSTSSIHAISTPTRNEKMKANVSFNVTGKDDPSLANISAIPVLSPPSPERVQTRRRSRELFNALFFWFHLIMLL